MAIYCPQCKARNPFGAQICGDCGQGLAVDSTNLSNSSKLPNLAKADNSSQGEIRPIIDHTVDHTIVNQATVDDKNDNSLVNETNAKAIDSKNGHLIHNIIDDTMNIDDPVNAPVQMDFSPPVDDQTDLSSSANDSNKEKKNLPQFKILSAGKRDKSPFLVQVLTGILFAFSLVLLACAGLSFNMKVGLSMVLPFPFLVSLPYQVELLGALIFLAGFYTFVVAYSISNLKKWAIKLYISWVLVQVGLEVLARIYQYKFGIPYSTAVMLQLIIIPLLWRIKYKFYY